MPRKKQKVRSNHLLTRIISARRWEFPKKKRKANAKRKGSLKALL